MKMRFNLVILFILTAFISNAAAEDGHELWLRKQSVTPVKVICSKRSPVLNIAVKELEQSWHGPANATVRLQLVSDKQLKPDGFKLDEKSVQANTELGVLYGVYELLRRQQTGQ